jgi:hypothetical protein
MYFLYLMFSEICINIFSELLLEYVVFNNFTLIWV